MSYNCKFINENLIEYVYDEITDAGLLKDIKEHLKICAQCREKYEMYLKIKENIKKINVDFPDEIWDLHRETIKNKIKEKKNIFNIIKENIFPLFNIKKVVFAFLIALFMLAGFQFMKINQEKAKYKSIIENMEILEDITIIEQLDFYTKIKEGDFDL